MNTYEYAIFINMNTQCHVDKAVVLATHRDQDGIHV